MKVLLASIYYAEIQQCYPIFVESVKALDPKPAKTVLYDLFEQKKLEQEKVSGIIEIRTQKREKELMQQVSRIRNEVLKDAKEQNFDAVLFLQPNLFAPHDIISRMWNSQKEVIAPTFFSFEKGFAISNALKKTGTTKEGKDKIDLMLFDDLIPSGVKKVFGVSLETVFLKKNVFGILDFKNVNTALDEMVAFSMQLKTHGKEIFADSSTVCSKLNPMQLMSYYYFKAQKLAEKNL